VEQKKTIGIYVSPIVWLSFCRPVLVRIKMLQTSFAVKLPEGQNLIDNPESASHLAEQLAQQFSRQRSIEPGNKGQIIILSAGRFGIFPAAPGGQRIYRSDKSCTDYPLRY